MAARQAMIDEIQKIKDAGIKRANELELELKSKKAKNTTEPVDENTNAKKKKVTFLDDIFEEHIENIEPEETKFNMSLSESADINFCGISMKEARNFLKEMGLSKLMGKKIKKVEDKTVCDSLKTVFPSFVFRLTHVLGSGEFGSVFSSRGPNNEKSAVKAMLDGEENTLRSVRKELDMGSIFHEMGLAPEMLGFESRKFITDKKSITIHFISMGRVDSTVQDYVKEERTEQELEEIMDKVFDVIIELKENDVNHGDFHIGNIGLIYNDDGEIEIKLIDFGFSMMREFVELDILQLIRVTHIQIENPNRDILDRIIRRKAKEMFGIEYPEFKTIGTNIIDNNTIDEIEKIQDDLRDTIISEPI